MNVMLAIGLLFLSTISEAHPTTYTETSLSNSTLQSKNPNHVIATETGRDKKVEKYLFPILAGFKVTGLLTATFTALKIFIIQSLVVSKIALFGATLLALKVIYDHMKHKFSHAKGVEYPYYHKPLWPEWYPYPDEWSAGYNSYSSAATDLHSLHSEPDRTALPHVHGNQTFDVRSDREGGRLVPKPKPAVVGYGTIVTRITETTSDD